MKIRKEVNRIFAILIALMVGLTMCASMSFAATPSNSDKGTITVTNVESGATVKAYKIVKANYNAAGLIGYEAILNNSIADLKAPTADEIKALASRTSELGTAIDLTADANTKTTYKASDVAVGTYLVIVTDTNTKMYNPMVVSVGYKDGNIDNGSVDSTDVYSGTSLAKSANGPDVKKVIVDAQGKDVKGDDVAIGDSVNFKIETTFPSYNFDNPTFEISDTLTAGFDAVDLKNVKVYIDNKLIEPANQGTTNYNITQNGTGFKIEFDSNLILKNGLKDVKVTYSAVVNSTAGINYDANVNTAKIVYSNDPTNKKGEKEDKTYTYTFGIDANLGGTEKGKNTKTHELIKVNEDGTAQTVETAIETGDWSKSGALAGATFTLTNNVTKKVYTATSDAKGYLEFKGLDAGKYTLKETAAPTGYTVNTNEIPVEITASYNTDGTLAQYKVIINNQATSTYTATYTNGVITDITSDVTTTVINNNGIPELPNTGDMGVYAFVIVGTLALALGLVTFVRIRRKS